MKSILKRIIPAVIAVAAMAGLSSCTTYSGPGPNGWPNNNTPTVNNPRPPQNNNPIAQRPGNGNPGRPMP